MELYKREKIIASLASKKRVPISFDAFPLLLSHHPDMGLGVVASRDIHEGEVILRECPVSLGLKSEFQNAYCGFCSARLDPEDIAAFKNQPANKDESSVLCGACSCIRLVKEMNSIFADLGLKLTMENAESDLSIYRFLLRLFIPYGGAREAMLSEDVLVCDFKSLFSLANEKTISSPLIEDVQELSNVICSLFPRLQSREEMEVVMLNAISNHHAITDPRTNQDVGKVVYGRASLINHSCDSNCSWTVSPDHASIISCKSLKAIPKGDKITISYSNFPDIIDAAERREWLWRERGFWCLCTKCAC